VFSGVILVMAVIYILKMITEWRAKEAAEASRAAEIKQNLNDSLGLQNRLKGVTPELLIARCGKPFFDSASVNSSEPRIIEYPDARLVYLHRDWVITPGSVSTLRCAKNTIPGEIQNLR
jgi:hypothetical protein